MDDNSNDGLFVQAERRQEIITIRNENDAWQAFTRLSSDAHADEREQTDYALVFEGWNGWKLKLTGEKFKSSVTPAMMDGYNELQAGIYRVYALLQYGIENASVLTDNERRELQLKVIVREGSSKTEPDVTDIIKHIITQLGDKMKPWHVIVTILGVALMYFGSSSLDEYLQGRRDIRMEETRSKEMRDVLSHLEFAGDQENERLNIMAGVAQREPAVKTVVESAETAHKAIVKSITNADTATIGDREITATVAKELIKNSRETPNGTRMDGAYRILRVNSGSNKGFLLQVRNIETMATFTAQLDKDFPLSPEQKAILSDAEWNKQPVNLKINAEMVRSRIIRAVILGVSAYTEQPTIQE